MVAPTCHRRGNTARTDFSNGKVEFTWNNQNRPKSRFWVLDPGIQIEKSLVFKLEWLLKLLTSTSIAIFKVENQIQLNRIRYSIAISAPHSTYRIGTSFTLGEEGHRAEVLKDDFQAQWKQTETVSQDPNYRTHNGKIHYIQTLERDHPLIMRKGTEYRLALSFEPDITFADA